MRLLALIMVCLFFACGEKDSAIQSNEPTNLILNVEKFEDPIGKV